MSRSSRRRCRTRQSVRPRLAAARSGLRPARRAGCRRPQPCAGDRRVAGCARARVPDSPAQPRDSGRAARSASTRRRGCAGRPPPGAPAPRPRGAPVGREPTPVVRLRSGRGLVRPARTPLGRGRARARSARGRRTCSPAARARAGRSRPSPGAVMRPPTPRDPASAVRHDASPCADRSWPAGRGLCSRIDSRRATRSARSSCAVRPRFDRLPAAQRVVRALPPSGPRPRPWPAAAPRGPAPAPTAHGRTDRVQDSIRPPPSPLSAR